jgi:quercetin dioxygenase-like cupin family protein
MRAGRRKRFVLPGASRARPTTTTTTTTTHTHAVHRLAADLLLVFKPRGHREGEHAHPHRQRLRVLRGRLRVETAARTVTLTAASPPFTLAAGRRHATQALADTWLLVESRRRPRP